MLIARWQIDARFGHKQAVIDALTNWNRDIGAQIGWTADKLRVMTGSIGALESTVISEVLVEDLGELNASFDKLATIEAHAEWSKALEPHVVSGTSSWQVLRVV